MGVYKEIGYLVREIKNKSVQIFDDAADYGVPIFSKEDSIVKLVSNIMKLYDIKPITNKYPTGATQKFELNGGYPAVIEAGFEKATIFYVTTRGEKNMIGYIYAITDTSKEAKNLAMNYDY